MKSGKRIGAAAAALAAALLCATGTASAAVTGSVTGDDGNPAALAPNGAPAVIRNMDVHALSHVDAADAASFNATVTDPAGVGATTASPCWDTRFSNDDTRFVDYHGNGTYKLTLTTYSDNSCGTRKATTVYSWTVNAGVAIGAPAGPVLTRQPNSFSTITQALPFNANPGELTYEVKYALGGVIAPDGSISGPSQDAFVNGTTGNVEFSSNVPGTYVMVARAKAFSGYFSPWSAPVTIHMVAPFDLSTLTFPDQRGPSYSLRGTVGDTSAAGSRVTISAAFGKHGKHFRTLGKARVSSKGTFSKRFRLKKLGYYRLRFSFPGSATVTKGAVYVVVKIRRVRIG